MKRKIAATIIGMAAALAVTSVHAQGKINLDNYDSALNPLITYGANTGGPLGTGILNGTPAATAWTIGLYYALGDVSGSVASDPTGIADPSGLGGGLGFASGAAGDTTTINNGDGAGFFTTTADAVINGYTSGLVTIEVVAYNGANYGASTTRGHSSVFTMTPATGTTSAPLIGDHMPSFSVLPVPEPSIFALSGLGAAALMLIRRKK